MNEREHVMRRVYSLPLVVLCIVVLASLVGGCFGSSDEPTTATSETTVTTAVTTSTTASSDTTDGMMTTTTDPNTLVEMDDSPGAYKVPVAYLDSLEKRPIVVMFYVPGGVDDEKVLTTVRELESIYDSYTFLVYDYTTPAVYGDLATVLGIQYPPRIVEIDREGVARATWSGYIDKGTLNQSLLDLGRY